MMKQRIKAVSLDMGYTLGHPVKSSLDIYVEGFRHVGVDLPEERIREATWNAWMTRSQEWAEGTWKPTPEEDRRRVAESRRMVVRTLGLPEDILPELNSYIDRQFADPNIYTLFPDSLEAVRRLREAGFILGITSNWSWHLPEVCERLGLTPYLDFVVVSARVGAVKPHRRIFEETVDRAGVLPEEIIHVGDDIQADIIGALESGLHAALLDRTGDIPKDDLPDGVPVFGDLLEFARWISNARSTVGG
jgi:HAD superfamily hydrolase (TIGR01509 family)